MSEFKWPEGISGEKRREIEALREVVERGEGDARAALELGNLLYDCGMREEAVGWWERAVKADRNSAAAWRQAGIGYYNVLHDKMAARGAYERAFKLTLEERGDDEEQAGKLLYERDQLWKRTGATAEERKAELEKYPALVKRSEDLTVDYCAVLNQMGQHTDALAMLRGRQFGERAESEAESGRER